MSKMNIRPIEGKGFGAIIVDVDLPKIDDEKFGVIKDAFLEYGFLVFPAQHLSDEENIKFGQRFGQLEFGSLPLSNQERNKDGSYGKVMDLESQMMRNWLGNEAWHTDSTYMPISSKVAMLSAKAVPDSGGETELADARAGYAALGEPARSRIENLSAYHSVAYSQANDLGDFPEQGEGLGAIFHGEAYLRSLVKVHPETGIKNLFIGRHAFGIPGMATRLFRT